MTTTRPQAAAPSTQLSTQLRPGDVVFDASRAMVCVLWALDGDHAEVARPTGLHWRTRRSSLHPATAHQQREIAALTRLRRNRIRGLP